MRLVLERRAEHSQAMAILSPVVAIGLTLIAGAIIFTALGLDPLYALYVYFVDPLTSLWSLEQLVVKATPLILIGVGLAVCFTANVWNIGAEGQLTMGAVFASMVPILMTDWQSPLALGAMIALGCIGGMLWAFIPGILKTRFGASEILTSLMLSYVGVLVLSYLVHGPWRDPVTGRTVSKEQYAFLFDSETIEVDRAGGVSLVLQAHGVAPTFSRNIRTALRAPLSVNGDGCGR